VLAALILLRHKDNVVRLLTHKEPKISNTIKNKDKDENKDENKNRQ
jgi:hypothetical protein